ncbi:FecR domain-containing protein [Rhodohalobacter mucosus]|uniref:FecR domain-containing protein n=1 Tax=Rhodohalobacter mucosus TaxID=2079485 RepID=UPI001304B3F2|nr:FecR domain-containing protein [Rhodohalobacter mucosus]
MFYPQSSRAFVQFNNPSERSIQIVSDADTVLSADREFVRIALTDDSYLMLHPNSSIWFRAAQANEVIDVQLLRGKFLIHTNKQSQFTIRVMVNESLINAESANAGIEKSGFYWVEDGQIRIESLTSGSQTTIRKGMYAQITNSSGEIINGNLSAADMQHLSLTYKPVSEAGTPKAYRLESDQSGELVLREISGLIPAVNE